MPLIRAGPLPAHLSRGPPGCAQNRRRNRWDSRRNRGAAPAGPVPTGPGMRS